MNKQLFYGEITYCKALYCQVLLAPRALMYYYRPDNSDDGLQYSYCPAHIDSARKREDAKAWAAANPDAALACMTAHGTKAKK